MSALSILNSSAKQQPLPAVIDSFAKDKPNHLFITLAAKSDSTDGARAVTVADMARAVNRAASWLEKTLGKAEGFPVYSFMAHNYDLRYIIFLVAGIKAGHRTFLPSPRNSEEFHTHLITKIGIKHIVSSIPVGSYAQKNNCTVIEPPTLEELLADGEVEEYPYTKTLAEAWDDGICVLHSSGSTGPPKPIFWTNAYLEGTRKLMVHTQDGVNLASKTYGGTDLALLAMPLFHTAGNLVAISGMIFMETPMVMFPAASMLTADSLISFIKTFKPRRGILPPSVLEDISGNEDQLEVLRSMECIGFGGAPLAREAGEIMSKYIDVYSEIGSTEASLYPLHVTKAKDTYTWMTVEPLPGFTFRREEDGLSELVFERNDKFDWPVFHVFPNIQEYATGDLYEPHPTLPNTWHVTGRKDDVIVLSNGEKVVPLPMEETIRLAPEISGALFFGHGKFTVGALLEIDGEVTKGMSKQQVIETVWPLALKANKLAPAFGQLTKDMIIFTSKDKPMRRAPKGSTLRRATLALYSEEIEQLYVNEEAESAVALVKGFSETETQNALLNILSSVTGKEIQVDEDLFQSVGADSMQVIAAARQIKASLQTEAPQYAKKVAAALIYANPTARQLATAVRSLVNTGKAETVDAGANVRAMINKYSEGIAEAAPMSEKALSKYNVVLTGSTGSLGSYILSLLINDPAVGKIFALNRSDNSESRQVSSNGVRGLSTDMSKVVFLKASLGNKNFGLAPQDYQAVLNSTSLIIHNAWPVNFNQSLESFEPHIRGVRNFIDLAAASPLRPHIVFTSSIGTLASWEQYYPGERKPEALVSDSRPAQGAGYGEGKYVGEHLLAAAVEKGIHSTIARVGQIGGPVESLKGEWNRQEWVPSIVFSSAYMGRLPQTIAAGDSNWIPVDSMAKIVVELGQNGLKVNATSDGKVGSIDTFNLANPNDNEWSSLVPTIKARIPAIKEIVPYNEWYEQLLSDSENSEVDASKHPAVKLVDFFAALAAAGNDFKPAKFHSERAIATSKTMASVPALNDDWMNTWMTQWGF